MNTLGQREEDIFDAARQIADTVDRTKYLDRHCEGNPGLRSRVEDLLSAESAADRFFDETSTVLNIPEMRATAEVMNRSGLGEEPLGSRIGRYKLLEKLGEGGCGVVYLAEQEEPVRRTVALKIIKLGMETKSVIARFEAERQALAMMDHPNIARVFDAGATDRGPPYFVMELVRGVKITEYCDRNGLDVQKRLDLFIQVCHAIQHAHQKGIIHGDIKPSNVMVSMHDGVPVPKVIDFGISKATEARLSDKALFTTYAQIIGTPAYMSPEQAQMGGVDIDTRSDIYSLGVLLYELLTGRTPFDPKELAKVGLDEMRRTLRESEPARPSVKLAMLPRAELKKVAEVRQDESLKLIAMLRGDLDWVVMKALEKDRRRRFETANGLAMDIQRYLDNEPVVARPPSWLYRLQKLVRRNRVVFVAGGAVALALVAGMGTSTWLFFREREARQLANAAEQQQARLRYEAEVREKITQAAFLISQEKLDEADKTLDEIALTTPTLEGAAVYRSLGEWHALENRWAKAADRLSKVLRVDQVDGMDGATLDYLRCGPALLEIGDVAGYERFRWEAIMRFKDAPCPFADRIVKISLLTPVTDHVVSSLNPIVEMTLKALTEAEAAGDVFQAAWRCVSPALLEYRKGNYVKAVDWCRRCLAYPEYNGPRNATVRIILAMAFQRLGQNADARVELAGAREIIETKYKGRFDKGSPVQGFWFDWSFAQILLREATAMIEGPVKAK